jgi:membrane protein implicated in regulation of membrane protease activity
VTLVWIAVALVFAIVEVLTVALVAGFIAVGATGAAIAAFVGGSLTDQAIVFAVVSVLGLALARHPLLAYLQDRSAPATPSGAAGMIGQTALVVDPIGDEHHRGHVRIAGEDWPALTRDGRPVEAGVAVRIVEIRLATLIVEPAPNGTGGREGPRQP